MKKLLSILLILFILPSVFMLSACGSDNAYKLSNLKTDYLKIAEGNENVNMEEGKIKFDYSKYVYDGKQILTEQIASTSPYKEISKYDLLLDNILGFVYECIDVCSSNTIEADAGIRNQLKADLDSLNSAVTELNTNINEWAKDSYL